MSDGDIVVDDHLLLRILLDDEPAGLRPDGGHVATTGLWYHRLCRALSSTSVAGSLSSSLGAADPELGARATRALIALPTTIRLVSMRDLGWPMADLLRSGLRLNLMSLEALAAAEFLDAEICLATADDNQPLVAAAGVRSRLLRFVA